MVREFHWLMPIIPRNIINNDDDDVEEGNIETPLNKQKQSNYTYQLSSRVFKISNFFGDFIKAFLHGSILTPDFFQPFLHLVLLSFNLHKLFTGCFIFLKSIMSLAAGNASLKSSCVSLTKTVINQLNVQTSIVHTGAYPCEMVGDTHQKT